MSTAPRPLRALLRDAPTLLVPAEVLPPALTALAEADGRLAAAEACLPLLGQLPGVRAAAVVQRAGDEVVVLASVGYECGAMGPGGRLPLSSGLPVTEAVRTGRLVAQGTGPAWVAAPFGRGTSGSGALLLSLDVAPPDDAAGRSRLRQLATALGGALRRAATADHRQAAALAGLQQVRTSLSLRRGCCDSVSVVVRQVPRSGPVGGDVALSVPGRDGSCLLLMADVCGSGPDAAPLAVAVQAAALALAPYADGPAQLLADLDGTVRSAVGEERFVTAAAVVLRGGVARVACAGHPPPLLLHADGGVVELAGPLGQPLALEGQPVVQCAQTSWPVPDGSVLALHTDGLTDRRGECGTRVLDAARLCADRLVTDLDATADAVLTAAATAGAPCDDVSLLLARHC